MWWTLAGASIASATALYIAILVYPRQRELDRRLELAREKRAFYLKLLEALDALDSATWGEEEIYGPLPKPASSASASLHLYAPPEIVDAFYNELAMRHELMSAYGYRFSESSRRDYSEVASDFFQARARLLRLLRKDVTGEDVDTTQFENLEAKMAFHVEEKLKLDSAKTTQPPEQR